jgi:hypothetical protein
MRSSTSSASSSSCGSSSSASCSTTALRSPLTTEERLSVQSPAVVPAVLAGIRYTRAIVQVGELVVPLCTTKAYACLHQ